jgi:ligand-binding sensor domain-containing protein
MKKLFYFFVLVMFVLGCNQQQTQTKQNTFAPKVVEVNGYIVPKDSMSQPKVVLVDEKKIKKIPVGKPKVVLTNANIHVAISTNIHKAGIPKICTPGKDSFLLPKTVPAISIPKRAGIPEVTIAKDPHINDNNPQSFSAFSNLQGLKHSVIRCMLQDKSGNLWFGTFGGGVSKYDGKSFTHFTDKEGLSSNIVLSMLEDKSGNIWFGTDGGGVSKYDGKSFTHFTDKEGLSSNMVLSMLEDKIGNIWFGTDRGGVSKYDPSAKLRTVSESFTHFTDKEGLSNNTVRSILEDKSGNLWFGTDGGGVSKYDGKSFTHFTDKEGLSSNIVLSMLEDKIGNIWFGTDRGGVSKYDPSAKLRTVSESFTHFTDKEGLSNNTVRSILEDKSGNLWFGTHGGGVSKYDGNRVEAIEAAEKRGEVIPQRTQQDLKRENGKLVKSFTHFTDKEGLSSNIVLSMLEDKSGNLWFGTFVGGVSKYDVKSFSHFTEKEGLSNNTVYSILEDKSGNIWFGTYGGGVSRYDGKSFSHFTDKEGLSSNIVYSILEDKSGNLWFGTYGGGVSKYDGKSFTHFTDKEGLSNNTVKSMLEDKSGNLWFGTGGGGVSKYDGKSFSHFTDKEGLSENIVYSILEDKIGNLWFGTHGGGVSKYDPSAKLRTGSEGFTHFTEKEGLSNNTVLSILEDKSGNLWFGTDGGGVSKYDGKSFTHFTDKEGLSNNTVWSMLEDKSGNLWFGTRFGLSKMSKAKLDKISYTSEINKGQNEELLFKNYTYDDGFYGIGCNGGNSGHNICQDKNGTIWIGANDRLTAFHPEGDEPDTIVPNIQLTAIDLFNENIPWTNFLNSKGKESQNSKDEVKDTSIVLGNGVRVGDFKFDSISKWYSLPENLSLAYNNNYLTFNYIGITQKQSKKVKYRYKLEGLDENWSGLTNRTDAAYGNLPQGNYTFKVKAMNSEGYWSSEFNYTFTIRPPWWKTWWMYFIYGSSALASVILIVWWNGRRLRARAIELTEEVDKATVVIREEKEKVELANKAISKQKKIVEEKHKEITDSINYAERIQRSFLASTDVLKENLKEYFIFFQPKEAVSGDFYWAIKLRNGNFALVTADSTGHGVPGAIMSILNISSLEKAVEEGFTEPTEILGKTRKTIIDRLKKDGSPEGGKDGMDASLICFDFDSQKFTYAAANNPIWVVRTNTVLQNGETGPELSLIELKPDKMPVGKSDKDRQSFTQNEFQLQKGDVVYTITDGLQDQFGGPLGKKFMSKKLKELLLTISHLPMQQQKDELQNVLSNWKGNVEQVDDITIIGVRI